MEVTVIIDGWPDFESYPIDAACYVPGSSHVSLVREIRDTFLRTGAFTDVSVLLGICRMVRHSYDLKIKLFIPNPHWITEDMYSNLEVYLAEAVGNNFAMPVTGEAWHLDVVLIDDPCLEVA